MNLRRDAASLSATLREETNLEALNGELLAVVQETVQPANVSFWLAPARGKEGDE